MTVVLDSSAVLSWLQKEPGWDVVSPQLRGGVMTAANWSEMLQKARQFGGDADEVGKLLLGLGVEVADIKKVDGEFAASLWESLSPLSLGDRLCLAVAERLSLTVMTADSRWPKLASGTEVRLIRD